MSRRERFASRPKWRIRMKPPRHDVQEDAPQKFVGVERQGLHAVVVGVVLPAEPDLAVAVIDKPSV